MQRLRLFALTLAAAAVLSACTPFSTYPRHSGSGQFTGPLTYPVPQVMAEAIAWTAEKNPSAFPAGKAIVFDLPEGTPPEVFSEVAEIVKLPARPMRVADEPAVHVEIVRIRGLQAEVDVIYPLSTGHYEMTTVFMERGMVADYEVTSTRRWHMRVEAPRAGYITQIWPPVKAVAKQPADPIE